MLYNEWAVQYFENQKDFVKKSTLGIYMLQYRTHIKEYWEGVELDDISSMKAQQFMNHLVNKPMATNPNLTLSKHSILDIMTTFKAICYEAMRQGLMHEFAFKLRMPKNVREIEDQTFKTVKDSDYEKLIRYCVENVNFATVSIIIAIEAGLRIGEVCGLTWDNVDFETNTIKVRQILNRIILSDGSTEIQIGEPKTKSSRRDIPMTKLLCELLKAFKTTQCQMTTKFINGKFKTTKINPNGFVISSAKQEFLEPRTLRTNVNEVLKVCGIDYIHFHNLRHTFCSYGLKKGIDIKIMSELMGHTKTDITMEIYTHISEEQKVEAIDKLNKSWS